MHFLSDSIGLRRRMIQSPSSCPRNCSPAFELRGFGSSSTVLSYALYTISEETVAKFGTNKLFLTVPFVLYGIFRYLYVAHQKGQGGSPTEIVFRDRPLALNLLFWIGACAAIIYWPE